MLTIHKHWVSKRWSSSLISIGSAYKSEDVFQLHDGFKKLNFYPPINFSSDDFDEFTRGGYISQFAQSPERARTTGAFQWKTVVTYSTTPFDNSSAFFKLNQRIVRGNGMYCDLKMHWSVFRCGGCGREFTNANGELGPSEFHQAVRQQASPSAFCSLCILLHSEHFEEFCAVVVPIVLSCYFVSSFKEKKSISGSLINLFWGTDSFYLLFTRRWLWQYVLAMIYNQHQHSLWWR